VWHKQLRLTKLNSYRSAGDVGWLRAYDRGMRYAQRGGYTPAEQQRRERPEAAGRFARSDAIGEIAHDPRVTEGSVRRWRRAWEDGGIEALRSKGPVSRERLSPTTTCQPRSCGTGLTSTSISRRSWRSSPRRIRTGCGSTGCRLMRRT
jgi:hypothetical protein